MIFAQILNGSVKDCIVLDDLSLVPLFSQGFDQFLQVDHLNPRPGPGWACDAKGLFTPPKDPALSPIIPQKQISDFNVAVSTMLVGRDAQEITQFCNDCSPLFNIIAFGLKDASKELIQSLVNPVLDQDYSPQNPGITNRQYLMTLIPD